MQSVIQVSSHVGQFVFKKRTHCQGTKRRRKLLLRILGISSKIADVEIQCYYAKMPPKDFLVRVAHVVLTFNFQTFSRCSM